MLTFLDSITSFLREREHVHQPHLCPTFVLRFISFLWLGTDAPVWWRKGAGRKGAVQAARMHVYLTYLATRTGQVPRLMFDTLMGFSKTV